MQNKLDSPNWENHKRREKEIPNDPRVGYNQYGKLQYTDDTVSFAIGNFGDPYNIQWSRTLPTKGERRRYIENLIKDIDNAAIERLKERGEWTDTTRLEAEIKALKDEQERIKRDIERIIDFRNEYSVTDPNHVPILHSRGTFPNLAAAETWAKQHLQGVAYLNQYTGEHIRISRQSISEMLAPKSSKTIGVQTHMAALQSVPDFIRTGFPAEIHPDTHGRDFDVMCLYNAIEIDGKIYRVKSTVKRVKEGDKYYTYELQEMELIEDTQEALGLLNADNGGQLNSINSISVANLLKGAKKTNSDEEILAPKEADTPNNIRFRIDQEADNTVTTLETTATEGNQAALNVIDNTRQSLTHGDTPRTLAGNIRLRNIATRDFSTAADFLNTENLIANAINHNDGSPLRAAWHNLYENVFDAQARLDMLITDIRKRNSQPLMLPSRFHLVA